jgi:hypothetical protein
MQHDDVSLAAAATTVLTALIERLFNIEDTSRRKEIEKLLSEGSPRFI